MLNTKLVDLKLHSTWCWLDMKNHTKHTRYFINAESELCGGLTLLDLRVLGRELEGSQMYSYYVHIISYKFGENLSIG